jgi:hypothetical protein
MPTRPILALSVEQLDSIPEYLEVREPQLFQQGGIRAIVDPRRLEYGVPVRSDLIVLQLLKDNLGIRPMYIARTTGGYHQALGLEPYALVQGLATKIMGAPLAASSDTLRLPGLGYLDVPRSRALWKSFGAPDAIIRRGDWVDRPSISIPVAYVGTALLLGQAYEAQGKAAAADSVRRRGVDIAEATHTLDLFVDPRAVPPAPRAQGGTCLAAPSSLRVRSAGPAWRVTPARDVPAPALRRTRRVSGAPSDPT